MNLLAYTDDFSVNDEGHVTAKRGLETVDLAFDNIQLEMATKAKRNKRKEEDDPASDKKKSNIRLLLDGSIHGRAKPGRMLAVMGPSGA